MRGQNNMAKNGNPEVLGSALQDRRRLSVGKGRLGASRRVRMSKNHAIGPHTDSHAKNITRVDTTGIRFSSGDNACSKKTHMSVDIGSHDILGGIGTQSPCLCPELSIVLVHSPGVKMPPSLGLPVLFVQSQLLFATDNRRVLTFKVDMA